MCVNALEALTQVGFIDAVRAIRAGKDGTILTHASLEFNRSMHFAEPSALEIRALPF
jgi:hypothetical protein